MHVVNMQPVIVSNQNMSIGTLADGYVVVGKENGSVTRIVSTFPFYDMANFLKSLRIN
jgi:hypothetical protein